MRGDWNEIPRSDLKLQEKLGEGAFGEAYKGLLRMEGKLRQCAVKKLKGKGVDCLYSSQTVDDIRGRTEHLRIWTY